MQLTNRRSEHNCVVCGYHCGPLRNPALITREAKLIGHPQTVKFDIHCRVLTLIRPGQKPHCRHCQATANKRKMAWATAHAKRKMDLGCFPNLESALMITSMTSNHGTPLHRSPRVPLSNVPRLMRRQRNQHAFQSEPQTRPWSIESETSARFSMSDLYAMAGSAPF